MTQPLAGVAAPTLKAHWLCKRNAPNLELWMVSVAVLPAESRLPSDIRWPQKEKPYTDITLICQTVFAANYAVRRK